MKAISSGIGMVCIATMIQFVATPARAEGQPAYRRLPVAEYRDKMKAGWIGQIAGVSLGAPTEFKSNDKIIPENEMPTWQPGLINQAFGQDDIYVEMTFLRTMELYGLDCSIRQAGIDFANTSYPLWCANAAGRTNLRKGIAPPDSSHPRFNGCATIIDYQIESDYAGLIAPGMPNVVIAMGDKFGRLMNYGDGVYAGQFIGAMVAEAFFESDIRKVVEAGLQAIPADCQYAAMVRDMLQWSQENPDWERTWQLLNEKYYQNPEYLKKFGGNSQVDCRINGAYALMGLLYGKGDPDRTMIITTRCGKDSDCNPSTAGGVLFTTLGLSKIPERFTKDLNEKTLFTSTVYNVPALLDVCEKLARQAVVQEGGRIEKDADGAEVFVIPVKPAKPGPLVSSFAPGPVANSVYTPAEMAQITAAIPSEALKTALETFAPGWSMTYCAPRTWDSVCGLAPEEVRGRKNVFVTGPFDNCTSCVLSRKVDIRPGKKTVLQLTVAHHAGSNGKWPLAVQVDGRKIYGQPIGMNIEADLARKLITPQKAEELRKQWVGKGPGPDGWTNVEVDLSQFAGQSILLGVANEPAGGYHDDVAYWAKIAVVEVGDAGEPDRISLGGKWKAMLTVPLPSAPSPDGAHKDPGIGNRAKSLMAKDADETGMQEVVVPDKWETYGDAWSNADGEAVFRRTVEIPAGWAGRELTLSLGAVDDFDNTYFDGKEVGSTTIGTPGFWSYARRYTIPAKLVTPGRHVIAVRVFDHFGDGGMVGDFTQLLLEPATP